MLDAIGKFKNWTLHETLVACLLKRTEKIVNFTEINLFSKT